jgi:hypothetical protein
MRKQDTASGGSPQGHPNLRTSADNTPGRSERQTFQFLAGVEFDASSDSGRKMCEDREVSQHLAAHAAKEIANSLHSSSVARQRAFARCKCHRGVAL